jgi:hypothetical protein
MVVALSEVFRNPGLIVGGPVGVHLGWKRATAANRQAEAQARQAEPTRRDFFSPRLDRKGEARRSRRK